MAERSNIRENVMRLLLDYSPNKPKLVLD